ncbi:MAG: YraN family protein [Pseudomonadota bacterium]
MAKPNSLKRKTAEAAGRRAETYAAVLLTLKGYRILARRFRCDLGEIDLIAKRGRLIIFVEVKARPTHNEGLWAISESAEARISAAATLWQARFGRGFAGTYRYDVITVVNGWPKHHPDAWRPDPGRKGGVNLDIF